MSPKIERLKKHVITLENKIKEWDKLSDTGRVFGLSTSERQDWVDELLATKMRIAELVLKIKE